jgi:DNA-binding CsgD family transcriptional regulator
MDSLVDLVGRAYEAAMDPAARSAFLETLADRLGGPTAIQHFDLSTRQASFEDAVRVDPQAQQEYCDHYAKVSPWMSPRRRRFDAGEVVHSALLTPSGELQQTEFYAGFLSPNDLFYSMGTVVQSAPPHVVTVSTVRSRAAGPYSEEEDRMFRGLAPHLRSAFQLRARLGEAEGTRDACLDALDRLGDGVLLVDRAGRVLHANRAGREILASGDGLCSTPSGLAAARPQDTVRLRALLAAASETSDGHGLDPGGALSLPRPSRRPPLALVVCALPSHHLQPDGHDAAAAVFVREPERASAEAGEVLARLYELTPAESRLADALATGDSLDEAAQRFGITRNTARAQLRAVFDKTGVSRQGALISLLLASRPPARN